MSQQTGWANEFETDGKFETKGKAVLSVLRRGFDVANEVATIARSGLRSLAKLKGAADNRVTLSPSGSPLEGLRGR